MGTFYRDSLARIGHEDTAEAIYEHWQAGDREAAMAAVDDELLDSIAVAGTPEEARERFARFAAIDGVDHVSVSFPRDATLDEIGATTAALAP